MGSSGQQQEIRSLGEVVAQVAAAGDSARVTVEEVLESVGQRSFGPLLLVPSLLLVSPLSSLPGLPSIGGVIIALISVNLALGRQRVWLPGFVLRRSVARARLDRAIRFLTPVARVTDRLVRPRLELLVRKPAPRIIGLTCLLIALLMPPLEIFPMANTTTAGAVALFALGLVARDGLLVLLAFLATGIVAYLAAWALVPGIPH